MSRMNESIDITQTVDVFFKRIDNYIQYVDDGEVPFMPEQILQTAYHEVSTCGHYNDACKIWRKKPAVAKTWALFKPFFAVEFHDLKEQQPSTLRRPTSMEPTRFSLSQVLWIILQWQRQRIETLLRS